MTRSIVGYPVLLMGLLAAHLACADDADVKSLRERLFAEGPEAWEKIKALTMQLEGSGTMTASPYGSDGGSRVECWKLKRNGDLLVFEKARMNEAGNEEGRSAWGSNSRYGFSIRRRHLPSPWALRNCGTEEEAKEYAYRRARQSGFLRYLDAPWNLLGVPLEEIIRGRGITIVAVSPVEEQGRTYAKVEFRDWSFPNPVGKGNVSVRDGWTILDPNEAWAIQRYELHLTQPHEATSSGRIEYGDRDGVPVPKRVTVRDTADSAEHRGVWHEQKFEFTELAFREIPESEFTLTAYQLPEVMPDVIESRPVHRLWHYVLPGGLFLLVAAFILRHVQARKRGG